MTQSLSNWLIYVHIVCADNQLQLKNVLWLYVFALKQATALVREGLVFGILGLMYCQVNNSCRGLCRSVSWLASTETFTCWAGLVFSFFGEHRSSIAQIKLNISSDPNCIVFDTQLMNDMSSMWKMIAQVTSLREKIHKGSCAQGWFQQQGGCRKLLIQSTWIPCFKLLQPHFVFSSPYGHPLACKYSFSTQLSIDLCIDS
jgi:hypothetical protein